MRVAGVILCLCIYICAWLCPERGDGRSEEDADTPLILFVDDLDHVFRTACGYFRDGRAGEAADELRCAAGIVSGTGADEDLAACSRDLDALSIKAEKRSVRSSVEFFVVFARTSFALSVFHARRFERFVESGEDLFAGLELCVAALCLEHGLVWSGSDTSGMGGETIAAARKLSELLMSGVSCDPQEAERCAAAVAATADALRVRVPNRLAAQTGHGTPQCVTP